ncbi:hypothetical protein BTVI_80491 [Pitangus sulphuratus]|nr:hypothetical protein BTVI_80491 [Pitangus sulphuratus]
MTRVQCSLVDEQPRVCDGRAMKIYTHGTFVDYSELRQVLQSITVVTEHVGVSCMAKLCSVLSHQEDDDKTKLVKAMKKEIAAPSCL